MVGERGREREGGKEREREVERVSGGLRERDGGMEERMNLLLLYMCVTVCVCNNTILQCIWLIVLTVLQLATIHTLHVL